MLNLESWNGPSDQLSQDQLWPKGRGDCDEQDHWCLLDFVQQIKCVGRFLFYWSRSRLLPAGGKQDSVHDGIWSALHSDFGWLWGGGISACALCMETLFLNFGLVIYVSNLKLCLWSLLIVCACPDIWVRCQYEIEFQTLAQVKQQLDKKVSADPEGEDRSEGIRPLMSWFQNLTPETVFWLSLGLAVWPWQQLCGMRCGMWNVQNEEKFCQVFASHAQSMALAGPGCHFHLLMPHATQTPNLAYP